MDKKKKGFIQKIKKNILPFTPIIKFVIQIIPSFFAWIIKSEVFLRISIFFIILFIFLNCILILCKFVLVEWELYRKLSEYREQVDTGKLQKDQFPLKCFDRWKRRNKKLLKCIINFAIIFIMLITLFKVNCVKSQIVEQFCRDAINLFSGSNSFESNQVIQDSEVVSLEFETTSKESEQQEGMERNKTWRFILDNPNQKPQINEERMKKVFFIADDLEIDRKIYILSSVNLWESQRQLGIDYSKVKDEVGNSYFTYTDLEDTFIAEVKNTSSYIYKETWLEQAPHSSEMDAYIAGRERLNEIEIDGNVGCYEIWWHLANDYQYYAQEYEYQTQNEEAILYYYVNSIYCCMEALKYADSEEEYDRTYHYMVMRYHDMCREDCVLSEKDKEKSYEIYRILVTKDSLYDSYD